MKKHIYKLLVIIVLLSFTTVANCQIAPPVIGQEGINTTINNIDQNSNINTIPSKPQPTSFDTYGKVDISESNGVPKIVIPIYTLEEDGVTLPIYLSYDASGIRVADIASEVGLKWSLHVGGSISRTIKGLADDSDVGWFNFHNPEWLNTNGTLYQYPTTLWNDNANCNQERYEYIENNSVDVLPDVYAYKLPQYEGSFFF